MRIAGPVLLFLLTLFWGATASADHMTGRYQGTGAIAGDVLDLRQSGTALQGTITGNDQGTLQGQTDGGNNAQGTIQLAQPGLAPISFQAVWSQQGLAMRLKFQDGSSSDVFFQLAGGPGPNPPGPGPNPPGPPPIPGPTDVQYFVAVNGQPVGPMTLQEIGQRIQQGQIARTDLVWKTGAPDWAPAESYPELAALFGGGPPPMPPGGGGNGPGGGGKTPPGGGGGGGGGSGGGGSGGGGSGGGMGGMTPPSQ